jgi:hypothetical protein
MAWNTDQIFGFTKFLIRKNQAGGISASDLFYAWNAEQSAYQSDLLGRFQAKNNGKSGQETGLVENETIMTKLTPFTISVPVTVTLGLATKPSDFVYALAVRCNGSKVFQIDHDTIWAVNQDVIDPPSIASNSYYYTEYQNYFSLLPAVGITSIQLDYIQAVTDIQWGYTFDVNGRQVYNPATSVQPQWTNNSIIEITKRTLRNFGISFSSMDFENFGNTTIATGE